MAKIVYGWVADWQECSHTADNPLPADAKPHVSIDLFFSSKKAYQELSGCLFLDSEPLVPVLVGDDFDDLDYIPDNY